MKRILRMRIKKYGLGNLNIKRPQNKKVWWAQILSDLY